MEEKLIYEEETYVIRGAVFEVYKTLGDGYLEEVYQNALEEELKLRGVPFVAKKQLHIMYKGRDCGLYEPDFICCDKIIVELKSSRDPASQALRTAHELPPSHGTQARAPGELLLLSEGGHTANRRVTFGWDFSPRNARKHTEHDSHYPARPI